MKKIIKLISLLLGGMLLISLFACSSSKVIATKWTNVDMNALPNGEYPVEFYVEDFTKEDGELYLKCKIYSIDLYDENELKNAKVGDYIERSGEKQKIETIIWNDAKDDCVINFPSFDEAAEDYRKDGTSGYYIMHGPDDYCTWTFRGEANIKLSKNCTYIDASDLEIGEQAIKYDNIIDYLNQSEVKNSRDNTYSNTKIFVSNGEITQIYKSYTP